MAKPRLLVIGLDGYELSLANEMIGEGLLPNMAKLREESAQHSLSHGYARYSGLAWEHVSTGLSPDALRRYSAVDFDPQTYRIKQVPTRARPVFADFSDTRVVVFDQPYCDLDQAPSVMGLTNWGAHDPGVPPQSNPPGLHDELNQRFGSYVAEKYIYGYVWPNVSEVNKAGTLMCEAVRQRTRCAEWLLSERLTDWELAMVVASEAHSSIEMMWHGIDPAHKLATHSSAATARYWLQRVYEEIDQLIGRLRDSFPDAELVLFSMHGMGTNNADIPGMVLLPEFMYRHQFSQPYFLSGGWPQELNKDPVISEDFSWHFALERIIPPLWDVDTTATNVAAGFNYDRDRDYEEIEWLPATRYQPFWPNMQAFALPAFYDGRIRLNLVGREANGLVPVADYYRVLDGLVAILKETLSLETGERAIKAFNFQQCDPFSIDPSRADLDITFGAPTMGWLHPRYGEIGPIPYRRPGGHTGGEGFAWIKAENYTRGFGGERSSFDIMPTLAVMRGESSALGQMSGQPIYPDKTSGE